jgi:hypothetical protein
MEANLITVEQGKEYRIWFDGWKEYCFLLPIENKKSMLYHKSKDFRYTHYINYWGHNLNQMSADYINDCLKFDEPIPISNAKNGYTYEKIVKIQEFVR